MPLPGIALFFALTRAWILLAVVALVCAVALALLHGTSLGALLHQHVPDRPRRRLFLAAVSFFLTFLAVRALTWAIHYHLGRFHDVEMGGRHIHHLVWGILILLLVGYCWLLEAGSRGTPGSILLSRLIALLFGAGAALTLDEFALWLDLRDVYWSRQGRASVDAVILFGALLAIGAWGAPFFRALVHARFKPGRKSSS